MIILDKKEGETPLEALGALRRKHPRYKDTTLSYAGRLDPMASGALLVLEGEEVHQKENFLKLDKVYEFEVLFGFDTDTHDVLGLVLESKNVTESKKELEKNLKKILKSFKGKFSQKYPLYSSRTVAGKPLWQYAREGESVERPEKEVEIYTLTCSGVRSISSSVLLKNIERRIARVSGDFRQKEVLKLWRNTLKKLPKNSKFYVASLKTKCSSGTYVRVLSSELGRKLGYLALAFKIHRKSIGKYKLS